MKKTEIAIIFALLAPGFAFADQPTQTVGVDLYGRSYHHDLPAGQRDKLNEANIGYALWLEARTGRHVWKAEAGTFLNSYYDQAYWVGGQYRYKLFRYFEPGLMVRHWETENGTYPKKAFNKYATVTVPLTERVSVSAIVRPSGYIAYLSFAITAL
jgi:hypothetical protein